jgi:general stress protein YciG
MAIEDRGFASMDQHKQREIASKGGRAAHSKGTAHEWTCEEAREAGRKGGMASHRKRQEHLGEESTPEQLPREQRITDVVPGLDGRL